MYTIVHLPNNHRFNKYLVLNSDPFKETTREATRKGVAGVAHEPGAQDHLAFLRKRLSSKWNHSFFKCFFFTIATIIYFAHNRSNRSSWNPLAYTVKWCKMEHRQIHGLYHVVSG